MLSKHISLTFLSIDLDLDKAEWNETSTPASSIDFSSIDIPFLSRRNQF